MLHRRRFDKPYGANPNDGRADIVDPAFGNAFSSFASGDAGAGLCKQMMSLAVRREDNAACKKNVDRCTLNVSVDLRPQFAPD